MRRRIHFHFPAAALSAVILSALLLAAVAEEPVLRIQPLGASSGNLVVPLCDGQTQIEVLGFKAGQAMDARTAQAVADAMMERWRSMNPGATWEMARNTSFAAAGDSARAPSRADAGETG